MRSLLRRCRRSHTAAAAYTALALALGGTAYAAVAVTSADIVDETIQSQDIAPGAVANDELRDEAVTQNKLHYSSVDGTKVINASLSGVDVANGSLTGWDIADGSLTADNVADRSLRGADVADDSLTGRQIDLGVVKVTASSGPESQQVTKTAEVTCPAGYSVVTGGGRPTHYSSSSDTTYTYTGAALASSRPSDSGQGWKVEAFDPWRYDDDEERRYWRLIAYALCAKL